MSVSEGALNTQHDDRGQAFVMAVPAGKRYTLNFFAKRKDKINVFYELAWCLQYVVESTEQ